MKDLLHHRGAFLELVIAALVLAFGVNLLASGIVSEFGLQARSQLLIAVLTIILAIALFARKVFAASTLEKRILGVVVYEKETNQLLRLPRYPLSESVSGYFSSLFAENSALLRHWNDEPLSKQFDFDTRLGTVKKRRPQSALLLQEAVEYFVLDKLSTHLTDYFNKREIKGGALIELGREDVPSVLFKNRFLEAFSRPMAERPAFVDHASRSERPEGEVVAAFGPGNVRFDRFDLVLPKKSVVSRESTGAVRIETPRLTLKIEAVFEGFNSLLPPSLVRFVLGRQDWDELSVFQLEIIVSAKFRTLGLFTRSGWEYHIWVDSFLKSLTKSASKKRFLRRISWQAAQSVSEVIESLHPGKKKE